MNVVLKKLTFENMFSYDQKTTIDFTENQICQIVGSNGVGKTSAAIILQELLYNKNAKGLKKSEILNRYSKSKSWEGSVEFSVGPKEYVVTSKRTGASTTVHLFEDGVDISEHKVLDTYKRIQDIIGRDFDTFKQLTYQSSVDSLEFLKATDTNRKKFLISLFNLGGYLETGEKIKVQLSAKEAELTKKSGELKTVVDFIETTTIPEKMDLKELPTVDETLPIKIADLKSQILSHKQVCDKIDKNNMLISERDNLIFKMDLEEPVDNPELEIQLSETKRAIATLEANKKTASNQLKSLDLADTCYACHQPLDNSKAKAIQEELQKQISEITKEINLLLAKNDEISRALTEITETKKRFRLNASKIDRFSTLGQLIDSELPTEYPNYSELSKELKDTEKELAWQQKELEDARKYNDSVRIRNAKIDGLKEQLITFKARRELINNDIIELQSEVTNLAILKKAFSTNGIVAYELENVTKQLEDKINYYLSILSDGRFQVEFRLTGDKLNVIVISDGQEVSVDSLSGGEFSRVQTAVLLAVRNTLAQVGGKNINLLFLDEVFAVLDDSGRETLIELLMLEKEMNVFIISHEYEHPLVPKITVVKEDKMSRLIK